MLDDPQKNLDSSRESDTRDIFAEQSEFYWNQLSECCEQTKPVAAIGIVNPDDTNFLIFGYGSIYEQTKLLAAVLRQLKSKIAEELDA